jgi:CheY-like chemotaxis protein
MTGLTGLKEQVPDVVIVDYHLDQERTGLQMLDDLRKHWNRQVRGLLITADRSEEVRHEAAVRHCEILCKPAKPAALRRFLIGAALHNRAGYDVGASP